MIEKIIEKSNILISKVDTTFIRKIWNDIDWEQKLIWIVGQRWIWKTTLMLQYLKLNNWIKSVYFSADNVNVIKNWLYEIIDQMYFKENIRFFAIDEIHKYSNWNQELKNIYDDFTDIKVIFSWSSSIDLIKWKYDLSRRLTLYKMFWFSFIEYLNKVKNLNLNRYSLEEILYNHQNISKHIYSIIWDDILWIFNEYLKIWYYPYSFESKNQNTFYNKLLWAIDKTIYEDISNFYKMDSTNLEKLRKIIIFYALSNPWELSVNALKDKLNLAHDTTLNYLEILQEVWLIKWLNTYWVISKFIRKAKKIYLDNTNMIYAFQNESWFKAEVWTIREVFFINQLSDKHNLFFSDVWWDFAVNIWEDKFIFEIWWKNKKKKQIINLKNAFIVSDDIIFWTENKIPLWLFGMLE